MAIVIRYRFLDFGELQEFQFLSVLGVDLVRYKSPHLSQP